LSRLCPPSAGRAPGFASGSAGDGAGSAGAAAALTASAGAGGGVAAAGVGATPADVGVCVAAPGGADALPEDRLGRMVGDGAATLVARAFAASGVERPADALERFVAIYGRALLNHTRTYDGILEALTALSARASLAVLTNKPLASTRRILEGLALARFFDAAAVIGGDGLFPRKPDPAGLRHLAARAGAAHDATLLVGDSIIDWRTAKAASASICLARYGFGFEGFPVEELRPGDRLIDHHSQLAAL
jgi:phosphoglycolate phosphatase